MEELLTGVGVEPSSLICQALLTTENTEQIKVVGNSALNRPLTFSKSTENYEAIQHAAGHIITLAESPSEASTLQFIIDAMTHLSEIGAPVVVFCSSQDLLDELTYYLTESEVDGLRVVPEAEEKKEDDSLQLAHFAINFKRAGVNRLLRKEEEWAKTTAGVMNEAQIIITDPQSIYGTIENTPTIILVEDPHADLSPLPVLKTSGIERLVLIYDASIEQAAGSISHILLKSGAYKAPFVLTEKKEGDTIHSDRPPKRMATPPRISALLQETLIEASTKLGVSVVEVCSTLSKIINDSNTTEEQNEIVETVLHSAMLMNELPSLMKLLDYGI